MLPGDQTEDSYDVKVTAQNHHILNILQVSPERYLQARDQGLINKEKMTVTVKSEPALSGASLVVDPVKMEQPNHEYARLQGRVARGAEAAKEEFKGGETVGERDLSLTMRTLPAFPNGNDIPAAVTLPQHEQERKEQMLPVYEMTAAEVAIAETMIDMAKHKVLFNPRGAPILAGRNDQGQRIILTDTANMSRSVDNSSIQPRAPPAPEFSAVLQILACQKFCGWTDAGLMLSSR